MSHSDSRPIRLGFALLPMLLCIRIVSGQSFSEEAEKAAVWTAATQSEIHQTNNYTALGVLTYAMTLYDNDPKLDPKQAEGYLDYAESVYRGDLDKMQAKGFEVSKSLSSVVFPPATPWIDIASEVASGASSTSRDSEQLRMSMSRYSVDDAAILARAYMRRQQGNNPAFNAVFDEYIVPRYLKMPATDTLQGMLNKRPDLKLNREVQELTDQLKRTEKKDAAAAAIIMKKLDRVESEVRKSEQLIRQRGATSTGAQPAKTSAQVRSVKQEIEDAKATYTDLRADLTITRTLLSWTGDRDLMRAADTIWTAGNAGVQIAESITMNSLGALSAPAMAAGILTGITQFSSLFGNHQSDPLNQFAQELQKQLAAIHKDLQARLITLDKKMDLALDQIAKTYNLLLDVSQDVDALRVKLVDVSEQLTAMRLSSHADSLSLLQLFKDEDDIRCLGYKNRHPGETMRFELFSETCLPRYLVYATSLATSEAQAGDLRVSLDDKDVQTQLDAVPLERSIRYLAMLSRQDFRKKSVTTAPPDIADAGTWSRGVAGFGQLLNDWPMYFARTNADPDISRLTKVGNSLKSAIKQMSGETPAAQHTFFSSVLNRYADKSVVAAKDLQARQDSYFIKSVNAELESSKPAFGAAEIHMCPGYTYNQSHPWEGIPTDVPLEFPELPNLVPPVYNRANQLGAGTLDVCYDAVAWDTNVHGNLDGFSAMDLVLHIRATFGDKTVAAFASRTLVAYSGRLDHQLGVGWRSKDLRAKAIDGLSKALGSKESLDIVVEATKHVFETDPKRLHAWYGVLAREISLGAITSLKPLGGIKAAFAAYADLAIPRTMGESDDLLFFLKGIGLPSDETLAYVLHCATTANASTCGDAAKAMSKDLQAVGYDALFKKQVSGCRQALDRAGRGKKDLEPQPFIDATLMKLELLRQECTVHCKVAP